jgi:hypothetical protein
MASNEILYTCTDTKLKIAFTLKDGSGNLINITGFTIKFSIRKQNATSNTNDSSNTCTLDSPTTGVFSYTFTATDCPTAGTYQGQIHITFVDGKVHRVPKFIQITAIETYL